MTEREFAIVLEAASVAVQWARMSPCAKSKRGVVIFHPGTGEIRGRGYNAQPGLYACTGDDACRAACGKRCVHAEVRAIRDAIAHRATWSPMPTLLPGLEALHVKIGDDGELVASGGPRCASCSREVLDVGIAGFWLYDGLWQRWDARAFHEESLRASGIPLPHDPTSRP